MDKLIVAPGAVALPPGAAADKVTVHVALVPDESVTGVHWNEDSVTLLAGSRAMSVEIDPFRLAVTVAV